MSRTLGSILLAAAYGGVAVIVAQLFLVLVGFLTQAVRDLVTAIAEHFEGDESDGRNA